MRKPTGKSFIKDNEGLAFLEFALSLSFLMILLLGGIEMARYIIINQKVEKTAMIVADVTAQGSTISTSQLDSIVAAATDVMQPFTFGANGYVIITSVKQNGAYSPSNPPVVNWQYTSSGANGSWSHGSLVGSPGQAASIPGNITLNDKDNVIISEVFYNYQPIISANGILTSSAVYRSGLYKPRLGDLSTLSALSLWHLVQGRLS